MTDPVPEATRERGRERGKEIVNGRGKFLTFPAVQTRRKVFSPGKSVSGRTGSMADTHYPRSYEIPRWARRQRWDGRSSESRYPSGVIFRDLAFHESTLALRDCSPHPVTRGRPRTLPSPSPLLLSDRHPLFLFLSLHCNHGNNHSSLSPTPLRNPTALSLPSLSLSLSFPSSSLPPLFLSLSLALLTSFPLSPASSPSQIRARHTAFQSFSFSTLPLPPLFPSSVCVAVRLCRCLSLSLSPDPRRISV